MLTPSLRVINSRTPNLCFRRPCSFLWFSIVSYNNYGGDSKLSVFYKFYFLVRHPVAISVVTDGDSTRDFRELGHLIKYKIDVVVSFFFLSFLFHSFFSSYILVCFILFYFISHYLLLLCIFLLILDDFFIFIYCSYYFILMLEF